MRWPSKTIFLWKEACRRRMWNRSCEPTLKRIIIRSVLMGPMSQCLTISRTIQTLVRYPFTIEKCLSSLIYNRDRTKVCTQVKMLSALKSLILPSSVSWDLIWTSRVHHLCDKTTWGINLCLSPSFRSQIAPNQSRLPRHSLKPLVLVWFSNHL